MSENKSPIIRALIVDDEEHARNELCYLLGKHKDVLVVGQAASGRQAIEAIRCLAPHLVFMDIAMPGCSGLEVVAGIEAAGVPPLVVFATAHEEFALQAFELNAVDYLLKPFAEKRVAKCLERVRGLLRAGTRVDIERLRQALWTAGGLPHAKVAIEQDGKAVVIKPEDIIMAECSDGQVIVHTPERSYQINMALQDLQVKLGERIFFRSHRSYLINLERVREIIPWFNGTYNLVLDGLPGLEVPVSRQQAPRLKKIFGL